MILEKPVKHIISAEQIVLVQFSWLHDAKSHHKLYLKLIRSFNVLHHGDSVSFRVFAFTYYRESTLTFTDPAHYTVCFSDKTDALSFQLYCVIPFPHFIILRNSIRPTVFCWLSYIYINVAATLPEFNYICLCSTNYLFICHKLLLQWWFCISR